VCRQRDEPDYFFNPIELTLFSFTIYSAPSVTDAKPADTSRQAMQYNLAQASNSMPSPAASSQLVSLSTAGIPKPHGHAAIAPQPSRSNADSSGDDNTVDCEGFGHYKKQLKRVANRRSAQLSRKRKKLYIEELKDENDGLRRKEQILKSIPDLIVVFDSSGKLWFVSESVCRFLEFSVDELEGTSIWNRVCDESVRLLKAAFMDSLAARQPESDTVPLGKGCWELRLVDKDGTKKVVTLNGVVHFTGDRPECVCSIRPQDANRAAEAARKKGSTRETAPHSTTITPTLHHHTSLIRVKPQQSVVSNDRSEASSSPRGKEVGRISDSGNSSGYSGFSDSGSSSEEPNTDQS
jgi:PAS domain S-box-containing protein